MVSQAGPTYRQSLFRLNKADAEQAAASKRGQLDLKIELREFQESLELQTQR